MTMVPKATVRVRVQEGDVPPRAQIAKPKGPFIILKPKPTNNLGGGGGNWGGSWAVWGGSLYAPLLR